MAVKCKPQRNLFDIVAIGISLFAAGLTISQNFEFISVAEGSALSTPSDPFVSFLALMLLVMVVIFLNKTRGRR